MSGFLFYFLSGIGEVKNRTVFFRKKPPENWKVCAGGGDLGERTSGGSKRRRVGRKDLLWVEKSV